ncbi:MAG: hypothetical protein EP349_00090 [Alphaproteobacteria bacterium]|nr:MAG: hypothetical protein EP349_00090 [Alphaproteobacteria bacterium]
MRNKALLLLSASLCIFLFLQSGACAGTELVTLLEQRVKLDQQIAQNNMRKKTVFEDWKRNGFDQKAAEIKKTAEEIDKLRQELKSVCQRDVYSEDEQQEQIAACEKAKEPVDKLVEENNKKRTELALAAAELETHLKDIQAAEKDLREKRSLLSQKIAHTPNDPQDTEGMKNSAMHILDALDDAQGDALGAAQFMEKRIRENLKDPNNIYAHEAMSYLMGLYAAQRMEKKDVSQKDPFAPSPDDSKALINAIETFSDDEKNASRNADADIALIVAQRWRLKWVTEALHNHNGDPETAMMSLRKNDHEGAAYGYRFLQGFLAAYSTQQE